VIVSPGENQHANLSRLEKGDGHLARARRRGEKYRRSTHDKRAQLLK
jgi:hypothetical protein